MWEKITDLFRKRDDFSNIDAAIKTEIELLAGLRKAHLEKLGKFNAFLLEHHTFGTIQRWQELQQIFGLNDPLERRPFPAMHARLYALTKSSLAVGYKRERKQLLLELFALLESPEFRELERVLFLQRQFLNSPNFLEHLADLKHLLEREGQLLSFESDTLTHIEDRLVHLHNIPDPFHTPDANQFAAVIKQVLALFGITNFSVIANGSTARETSIPTSDYDFVMLIPDDAQFSRVVTGTAFGKLLSQQMQRVIPDFPFIETIKFDETFHLEKRLGAQQIVGKLGFIDFSQKTELHIYALRDPEDFQNFTMFARNHNTWVSQVVSRKIQRLKQSVPLLKEYLAAVGLYGRTSKNVSGAMMEKVLRDTTLKHLAAEVVDACLPWNASSPNKLHGILRKHGNLNQKEIDQLMGQTTGTDDSTHRAQRMVLVAWRIVRGAGPGFELSDFSILYPGAFCTSAKITGDIPKFIKFLPTFFPLLGYQVVLGRGFSIYLAFAGKQQQIEYRSGISLAVMEDLLKEKTDLIMEAASMPKETLPVDPILRNSVIDFFRWINYNVYKR